MSEGGMRGMERYLRQLSVEGFGVEGQRLLGQATVGVLGVGGLGSPAALYLAAAGVGHLILADDQAPELSNLNRQVLHWEADVERHTPKVESAAAKLRQLNSEVEIRTIAQRVDECNIGDVFEGADVILDCLDNFETRYLLNRYCVHARTPFVHAAVEGLSGQLSVIVPGETPCVQCIFPRPPGRKAEIPVVGAAAGVFGALQAGEAIKLITGIGRPLKSRLLVGDIQYQSWDVIDIGRDVACPVCSNERLKAE
jgi:molybdopterin/thiamine biosynthesis adenylyltransferase